MHANMAKPRLWRWGICGYIGGESIFWSGVVHVDIFWVRLANNVSSKSVSKKIRNSNGHIP
jgi:hypothetical protein